jgi:PAS domain S-box-containing protein
VQLTAETKRPSLNLHFLPGFAQYILTHQLEAFVRLQYRFTYDEGLQLLAQAQHMSEEEQLELGRAYSRDLLTHLADNRPGDFIRLRMEQWQENSFFFDKYAVITEDIPKLSYIRKQSFAQLLPEYCVEGAQMLQVLAEIDRFFQHYDSASLEVLIRMLESQAAERSLFIEKINSTLPGALYIFELDTFRNLYSNENFAEILGYTMEELNQLGASAIDSVVHPDDRAGVQRHLEAIRSANDGEILSYQYRIRRKNGEYRWFRNFESIFRRNASGAVTELIAICLDVNSEKQTAERLRQREEELLEAQAITHIGSYYWVINEPRSTGTPELYNILETDINDHLSFMERVHPDDRARMEADIKDAFKTGIFESEYRYHGSDQEKYLWARGVVHYRDGVPYAISGTVTDITDRKDLQRQAAESERLYKKVEVLANMGNWQWDEQKKELHWTDNLYRIYGLEPQSEPITRERFLSFVHPEDRAVIMDSQSKGYPEDVTEHTFRIITGDGRVRTLHSMAQVERDADGRLLRVFGAEKDITDQVEAQRRIEEQDYFIQQLADATPMVLYLFDIPSGRFHYLNREIFYVLGYTPEEVMTLDSDAVRSLYHPDDLAVLPERTGSSSNFHYQESMMQYECRMRKKDGDWYWLLAREVVFRKDEAGNVLQILGAALDINRRKEMERTLLQNAFQLEQSNASLEEFAYIASHDLKEPLRKISTFGDRLVATQIERMSEDGKMYLRKVVDASQRMQAMIDDLLSVSRISGNRSFEKVNLNDLLRDALQTLEFKIEQQAAKIVADDLPEAEVVPSQFRQLFQNLLSNSLKFAREGVPPEVHIHYRYLKPADVEGLQLRQAPAYLELTFQDNGIGFENEYSGKIFQIFQRLNGRSEYEGNGIGLAIVKKIMEHHGGAIGAAGVPDKGAVFTLTLPL